MSTNRRKPAEHRADGENMDLTWRLALEHRKKSNDERQRMIDAFLDAARRNVDNSEAPR